MFVSAHHRFEFVQPRLADEKDRLKDRDLADRRYRQRRVQSEQAAIGLSEHILGIGIGDRVAMLENAYYSVISPEGCATILWKGAEHAERAAAALHLTGKDLLGMGIIDEVIPDAFGPRQLEAYRASQG